MNSKGKDKMDEKSDFRKWDELLPDVLGQIFKHLSLSEVLTVAPSVCKSWEKAVKGPYCWQEIDISGLSRNSSPEIVNALLEMLIRRSDGSLRKLNVSGVSSDLSFLFVDNSVPSLGALQFPRSGINVSISEKYSGMLANITCLDLSCCMNVGAKTLYAIGKHCKYLTDLRRVMHPSEVMGKPSQDDEALAIAASMPRLKRLKIAYLLVETSSVTEILGNCKDLELLDVRGCRNVNLDESVVKRLPNLKVVGPHVEDFYDSIEWGYLPESIFSGGALIYPYGDMDDDYTGVLDDFWEYEEDPIDDLPWMFYDDYNAVDAEDYWPRSP